MFSCVWSGILYDTLDWPVDINITLPYDFHQPTDIFSIPSLTPPSTWAAKYLYLQVHQHPKDARQLLHISRTKPRPVQHSLESSKHAQKRHARYCDVVRRPGGVCKAERREGAVRWGELRWRFDIFVMSYINALWSLAHSSTSRIPTEISTKAPTTTEHAHYLLRKADTKATNEKWKEAKSLATASVEELRMRFAMSLAFLFLSACWLQLLFLVSLDYLSIFHSPGVF